MNKCVYFNFYLTLAERDLKCLDNIRCGCHLRIGRDYKPQYWHMLEVSWFPRMSCAISGEQWPSRLCVQQRAGPGTVVVRRAGSMSQEMLEAFLCKKIMRFTLELQGQRGSVLVVIAVLKRLSLKSEVPLGFVLCLFEKRFVGRTHQNILLCWLLANG